jgi:hypothetical protein
LHLSDDAYGSKKSVPIVRENTISEFAQFFRVATNMVAIHICFAFFNDTVKYSVKVLGNDILAVVNLTVSSPVFHHPVHESCSILQPFSRFGLASSLTSHSLPCFHEKCGDLVHTFTLLTVLMQNRALTAGETAVKRARNWLGLMLDGPITLGIDN